MKKIVFLLVICLFFAPLIVKADIPLGSSDITTVDGYAKYKCGAKGFDSSNNEYIYMVGASGSVARAWVAIDHDGTSTLAAVLLTKVIGMKGRSLAVGMSTVGAIQYGWYLIKGKVTCSVLASDAADVKQYCSTTSGFIDDSGTVPIYGVHMAAAASGSGTAFVIYPKTLVYDELVPLESAEITTVDGYDKYGSGSVGVDASDNRYIYLEGVASCAARSMIAIDHDGTTTAAAILLTETEGAKGRSLAVALSATTDTKYGWFIIKGLATLANLASDAADAEQLCTTTAGYIDDAGTTPIHGIHYVADDSGTGTAYVLYPHTGN